MGGDALPFPTQRLTPERHHTVSTRLLAVLATHYRHACCPPPRPGKPSHGDVDILVASPLLDRPFDPVTQLDSRAVNRNGTVLSFEYESHQVDVISVAEGEYGSARLFYSYGDVGMILGMMLRSAGVKFGYSGLSLIRHFTTVQLSSDRSRILAWLGMSDAEWEQGFADEQAVFAWLCTCRWFRHSHFARTTDTQWNFGERRALGNRPMFVHFIRYVQARSSSPATERVSQAEVQADAIAFFECESAVAALDAAVAKRTAVKHVWNGVLVSQRTRLVGKELGVFMTACRRVVSDEQLLRMDAAEVDTFIDEQLAVHEANKMGEGEESKEHEPTDDSAVR